MAILIRNNLREKLMLSLKLNLTVNKNGLNKNVV